jgi:hypothetical protein
VLITVFPVGRVLEAPSQSDLQNPSEMLPLCSGYEGCCFIEKIRSLFSKKTVANFISTLNVDVSRYSNKALLLLQILQQILSQVQLQTEEATALQHYIDYLTIILNPDIVDGPTPSLPSPDVIDILPTCAMKSLYCVILQQIGIILHKPAIYRFVQENAYNPAVYPTKEAYLQFILEYLISRNLLSVKELAFTELYLQYRKQQQSAFVISGNTLPGSLKRVVQPSHAQQRQQLFLNLISWLSKANLTDILGDYKICLSIPAEPLLKSVLTYTLSRPEVTQNEQIHQVLQQFVSKIPSNSTAINLENFVGSLGIEVMGWADADISTGGGTSSPVDTENNH